MSSSSHEPTMTITAAGAGDPEGGAPAAVDGPGAPGGAGSGGERGGWLRRPRRRALTLALAVVVVVAAAALLTLRGTGSPERVTEPRAPAMQVGRDFVKVHPQTPAWRYLGFDTAKAEPALAPLPAPGRILFDEKRSAAVTAPLPGRIEKVTAELGQAVREGAELIAIRSTTLPDLRRDAEVAGATVRMKRTALERVRGLADVQAVPQKDVLVAEQELREAELALAAAMDKKRALQIGAFGASGLYWIRAGQDGTVVERRALAGMEVGPERDEPLAIVARLDEVIAIADVVEAEAALIEEGQLAEVSLSSRSPETFPGRVEHVGRIVDPARRTVAVRVRVVNKDGQLRPNAFARISFSPGKQPLVIVPSEAVVTDDDRSVLFVRHEVEGGAFRLDRRPVNVGRTRDGRTEILAGLAVGETFVSRGALLILNAIDLGE
jgi:membrane fusion protein, heavy metal efflux system